MVDKFAWGCVMRSWFMVILQGFDWRGAIDSCELEKKARIDLAYQLMRHHPKIILCLINT